MAEGKESTSTMAPQHGQALMESLLSDFEKQEDCDIFFNVDGKTIGAHKMVLKMRGRGLLEYGSQQANDKNHIEVQSMEFDFFKMLLRYNYTGHIQMTDSYIFSLLHAATRFSLTHLQELCAEHISSRLTIENVCQLMEEAVNFNCQVLQQKCQEMFSRKTESIVLHDSFMQLSQPALSTFLDTEQINILEGPLFLCVKKWSKTTCIEMGLTVNGGNMREVIGDAIFKIRFPTMTAFDFGNYVAPIKGLLTDAEMGSVFQMITMFDNSAVDCPFPAMQRCRQSILFTCLPDAKMMHEKTELQDQSQNKHTIKALLQHYQLDLQHAQKPNATSLCLVLQCCADLANSTGVGLALNAQKQELRAEVYTDYCTLLEAMKTEDLSDIWKKNQSLRRKLVKLCPWFIDPVSLAARA